MHTILKVTQKPTDSALVLAYEHIVTQIKNTTDITCSNIVVKTL